MRNSIFNESLLMLCRAEIEIRQFGGSEAVLLTDRIIDVESKALKHQSVEHIIRRYNDTKEDEVWE